ncbi:Aspartic protease [Phytophthora megakarya]|uniref:Aspartic protease n=1 Tax=Phytophthora megakarya TaxID=4795 RepID=A0A225VNA4_9STRA|nr:Aspartic protease [Phytophthora megakarya]
MENRNTFCKKCKKWGHPGRNCWQDIICGNCSETGHPARVCRKKRCTDCGKIHPGIPCVEWRAFKTATHLASQGIAEPDSDPNIDEGYRTREATANPLSPLDVDPVRDGFKNLSKLCVLVCMGPERRRRKDQNQDNQQCMTLIQDEIIYPEQLYPEYQRSNKPDLGSSPAEAPVEVALGPGQRYGSWEDHDSENSYEIATVCGAINDRRTRIFLDTGASVSIVSLDLARRLSLQIRTHRQIKVSGLGGDPDVYLRACSRQDYPWLGIGLYSRCLDRECVDVLLGMNFMHSAGRRGLELPVGAKESLYLRPDEAVVVKIEYGQTNPQREVVWAGWGKRWMTEILFGARSWATAVHVSDRNVWIDTRAALAWIVEYGHFPKEPGFVRPGKIR